MKILIITVTAGYGHNSVAKSLQSAFSEDDVTIIDLFQTTNNRIKMVVEKGYDILTKKMNGIYRIIYNHALKNSSNKSSSIFKLVKYATTKNETNIIEKIKLISPDIIFCTHVFAALVMNKLKVEKIIQTQTYGIVTDFTIHPFWEQVDNIEHIVIDNQLMKSEALSRGIREEQILIHKIPIDPKFNIMYSKKKSSDILGLNPNKKTVLMMGGGVGCVDYYKYVKQLLLLPDSYQFLVVCGKNKKQFNKMTKLKQKNSNKENLYIYRFVDNIEIFMSAADCVVTKPGGLTVSEVISKKLPLFLIDPIAGQEERNLDFLVNNQYGIKISNDYRLDKAIQEYFSSVE
ncbi:MGDG synthase family glycosyltransferase [Anaerorhabdus sp.]|uniref:MGDG synthase family glycosyltransferase n=1 Tax=Anaerorhabdus sp. TaxID=1872524 RepID=UPI002FCCA618